MQQTQRNAANQDPNDHVHKVEKQFEELIEHLRSDVEKIDEPRAKAMFEMSAEVLGGLKKAFHDYSEKNEAAWR